MFKELFSPSPYVSFIIMAKKKKRGKKIKGKNKGRSASKKSKASKVRKLIKLAKSGKKGKKKR